MCNTTCNITQYVVVSLQRSCLIVRVSTLRVLCVCDRIREAGAVPLQSWFTADYFQTRNKFHNLPFYFYDDKHTRFPTNPTENVGGRSRLHCSVKRRTTFPQTSHWSLPLRYRKLFKLNSGHKAAMVNFGCYSVNHMQAEPWRCG